MALSLAKKSTFVFGFQNVHFNIVIYYSLQPQRPTDLIGSMVSGNHMQNSNAPCFTVGYMWTNQTYNIGEKQPTQLPFKPLNAT